MTTHDIDIELPPLPKRPEFVGPYTAKDMQAYARAAIEADRNRRGEPVARLVALYDSAKNKYRAECSAYYEGQADAYDMAIQIVESEAPQPAEPVDVDHGETRVNIELEAETGSDLGRVVDHGEAEPVKVPSDAESWLEEAIDEVVVAALEEGMCGRAMGDTPLTDSAKAGAMQRIRALLARYGQNLGRGKTRMNSGFQTQEAAEIGQVYVDGEGRE